MRLAVIFALGASLVASVQVDDSGKDGFVMLFNGKDLKGWKPHPKGQAKWQVVDGCITASGPAGHLFTDRNDYRDFIYRIEAKINDGGNSGQYFRAQFGDTWPKGYEAQINATHADKVKTGSLYPAFNPKLTPEQKDKILVKQAAHKPDEWFTQEVEVVGNRIVIRVNGKTTVDFIDENKTHATGHLALQHHDPGCKVMFKKIEIKELLAKD